MSTHVYIQAMLFETHFRYLSQFRLVPGHLSMDTKEIPSSMPHLAELAWLKDNKVSPPASEVETDDSERIRWRKEWYHFTQNTTLHGINKVTDDTPFVARRQVDNPI